ncbi:hypothetical protein CRYUN_Cryun23aG0100300 [Craigia yunnanensis]
MKSLSFLLIIVLLNLAAAVLCADKYSRYDFPPGFVFGSATSAYQVEGAASKDGRTPSIWDTFAHSGCPGPKVSVSEFKGYANGATGDVAVDQYHKYKEDVKLMAEMGLDAYRFSISWSRLIPNGRGPLNPKGVQYYNNLISELISHGIQPHVTLNNADLPQALEDEYGGWINGRIVKDFTAYADGCFREFGDRVSNWITVNEPNVFAIGGYDQGIIPPRHCSSPFGINCTRGNSSSEPYIAVHNILLAHASAARLYKRKYQEKHNGFIGISIYTLGAVPNTNSTEDAMAAQRMNDFYIGWIANPLVFGDYPDSMKKLIGSRIPTFTNHESELVRGSFDFFGVIHYTTCYVQDDPVSLVSKQRDFNQDVAAKIMNIEDIFSNSEYPILPWGLQGVLEYIKSENPAQFNLRRHIESGISAGIHRECAGCSKEWIGYKRLFFMVLPGCARDTGWLSIKFWLVLCRFG